MIEKSKIAWEMVKMYAEKKRANAKDDFRKCAINAHV